MQTTDPLIRTKFHLPFTRPGLVPRPRLQEQIVQGLRGPLTLITAPAGFGKTTLVASSSTGIGLPVAWLSVDRGDNQPGRFLTYLIASIQAADSRLGSEAAQLASGLQPAAPEAVLTSLINDMDSRGGELILVLDDYHFINSQAVHSIVAFLLEHCPRSFHLLIATRSDPPLPLARLRARGQTIELRAADLRFSISEAALFLNDVMGLRLDSDAVAILEERTEGWVAGLQMAALSMRDRKDVAGFVAGFSGTNRYILDYLLEEVLANQPPEIQHFLLSTSILERLSIPLCDALLAENPESGGKTGTEPSPTSHDSRSSAILNHLERENIFLVPLDDERVWFRYHHLFADLLRIRLKQGEAARVPGLHTRAAAWLEQNGHIPEAIHHLLAAHEDGLAADLVERFGPECWAANDLSVIKMAERLPHAMLLARPKVGLYQSWLYINQGLVEKAYPLLMELEKQFAGSDPNSDLHWVGMIVNLALAFLTPPSKYPRTLPVLDAQTLSEIPASERVLRDTAEILYGMALARRDDIDGAVEFSKACLSMEMQGAETRLTDLSAIPSLVPFLATMYLFQGRLHQTAELCRQYLRPIKESGLRLSTAGNLEVTLGNVMYEWNYLDDAEEQIREGLRTNEPWSNIMTDSFGVLALAEVLLAKGDYAGAFQFIEKFETRLQGDNRPFEFAEPFRTLRTRAVLASGDLRSASQWADQILVSEDFHLHPSFYQFTLACIRLAEGRLTEAEAILEGYSRLPLAGNRLSLQIEFNLLQAALHAGEGRTPEALKLLAESLALGEKEEYMRVFLNAGKPVQELLAAYLRMVNVDHHPYARKILDAFTHTANTRSLNIQPASLVEVLSERELEVLSLIALGQTNQEIARKLVISPGTVKAHSASIYRKLDTANRTEAVARARKLGILS